MAATVSFAITSIVMCLTPPFSQIKLNLLAYEKHGCTLDFLLEDWKEEVDEQLIVAEEAYDDAKFGKTFKQTRRNWAYNGV